jgi:hypothetical protein
MEQYKRTRFIYEYNGHKSTIVAGSLEMAVKQLSKDYGFEVNPDDITADLILRDFW